MMINIPTGKNSWLQGRNGLRDIKEIQLTDGAIGKTPVVTLDGISRSRGVRLNGGISIDAEAMDRLALEWLQSRGIIPKAATPAPSPECGAR